MSTDKVHVEHSNGYATEQAPTKKRKCMRHCAKFWWAYLIAFIISVVVGVLLIIFVIVPKIAQKKLNEAELDIKSVNLFDVTPDSFTMAVDSTITTDGSIHADIDAFTGSLYLEGQDERVPFAKLDFPATTADKHQEIQVEQNIELGDMMDAFTKFNTEFIQKEKVEITIEGDTEVQPSGLSRKYGVKFSKTMEVNALNMFKGTSVSNGKTQLEDDEDGYNFFGDTEIPNASHFTLDIGNITFTNFIDDEHVGELDLENVILRPGKNTFKVRGRMDNVKVLAAVSSDKYCKEGIVPMKLQGKTVKNNGKDIEYFRAGLASGNQTVPMPIAEIIKNSLDIDVHCEGDKEE